MQLNLFVTIIRIREAVLHKFEKVQGDTEHMDDNKMKLAQMKVVFSTLIFALLFFCEIYGMIHLSKNHVLIIGIAILAIGDLYILLNGIMEMTILKNKRREEQYEDLFKSGKASYLLQKKNFEEMSTRMENIEKASMFPIEDIVSAQKGIAKVIINRSKENAQAVLNSNDYLLKKIESFEEKLNTNNSGLLEKEKSQNGENTQLILNKQQEVIMSLKDMELRLNAAIMQSQKMVASQMPMMQPYIQSPVMQQPISQPVSESVQNYPDVSAKPIAEERIAEEKIIEESRIEENKIEENRIEENIKEETMTSTTSDPVFDMDEVAADSENSSYTDIIREAANIPLPDISDPNKKLNPDEIASLFANMEASKIDTESLEEPTMEPIAEPVMEPIVEPVIEAEEEPSAPAIDLSDPNKKLGDDEIAALFASMGASEPASEPVEEPIVDPVIEAEEEPSAPAIDLSDPNKKLDADEIAALFASMGASEPEEEPVVEPVVEPAAPEIDLSDPNKKLSADEIAALFAAMG